MKSKDVDKYLERFEGEKKRILTKLRGIILKAFPKMKEEMKMGVPWYGGRFYLVGLKDHVNMGFCVSRGLEKSKELEGSGKYMRHLKFRGLKDIDEKKIVRLMRLATKTYGEVHKK